MIVIHAFDRADLTRPGSEGSSLGGYSSSKFDGFVGDPMLRNIFGQKRSTINPREIMDAGKILLVNLSKGRLGEINSRFFGMVLIAKLQAAAMSRAGISIEQRRDFYVDVDEFQNLATANFGTLLSEGRKYRLNLVLTNQYISQVDSNISSAIAGNVGTIVSFRVGAADAELLERQFTPVFNRYDLMNLPNFNTCVSTLIGGQVRLLRCLYRVLQARVPIERFQRDVFLIRACPDGEGNFFGEIPLDRALMLRNKAVWDQDFVEQICGHLKGVAKNKRLVLVDVGGKIDRRNHQPGLQKKPFYPYRGATGPTNT